MNLNPQVARSHPILGWVGITMTAALVIDLPGIYLHEIQQELEDTIGTHVSVPTVCNFMYQSGFTRQKLHTVAL